MSFPVYVHQDNGHYVATLVGVPQLCVIAATREAALSQMQTALQQRISSGELVLLEPQPRGLMALAGKYRDDPTLSEIRDEIYRQRDAEPKE